MRHPRALASKFRCDVPLRERVATVRVFLTVGFFLDDEIECMHLNRHGKGWGIGPRGSGLGIRDQ